MMKFSIIPVLSSQIVAKEIYKHVIDISSKMDLRGFKKALYIIFSLAIEDRNPQ